jgi:hypothetical protein
MRTKQIHLPALLWLGAMAWALPAQQAGAADSQPTPMDDYALTVYYGRLSQGNWQDVTLHGPGKFADSSLAVAALSKTIHRSATLPLSFEVEGQVAKHFGEQDNWELNLLGAGRWHRFPWNDHVRTTAAFGVGPSYATSTPKYEVARNGTSRQLLAYWYLELTLGPPDADWSVSFRVHHRSTAFGLFGENGGYTAFAAGLRYPF